MTVRIIISIAVMAIVTYLVRMIPFAIFGKKVKNRFLKSFFYYVPYAVLAAMTVPYVFYSTSSFLCSLIGFITAIVLSYFNMSLIIVAFSSCLAALIANIITVYLF